MRVCERNIIDAILNGHKYANERDRVQINGDGSYFVWLYDTVIASGKIGEMPIKFCFGGWNTTTTRSRLRALGCALVRVKPSVYAVNGKTVRDYGRPFDAEGNPCKSMIIK